MTQSHNTKVRRRTSHLNNNTIDQDIHNSTFIHNKTQNEILFTNREKKNNKRNNEFYDIGEYKSSKIGQTYEDRNTIVCFENSGDHNTILTSQMYQSNFLFTNSRFGKTKIKQWSGFRPLKGIKVMNRDLEVLKSGKNPSITP